MLALELMPDEAIVVRSPDGSETRIALRFVKGERAGLVFDAPRSVAITRHERGHEEGRIGIGERARRKA